MRPASIRGLACLAVLALAGACGAPSTSAPPRGLPEPAAGEIEAMSLLGEPLRAMPLDDATRAQREAELDAARAALLAALDDEDAWIWYGRRLAYLGRYRDAVAAFDEGLRRHPDSARLHRHRGHRFITLRRFDDAIADLERAAELLHGTPDALEPDGQPNALGIPRSTTHSNVWYHLGLARYLAGDTAGALDAYRAGLPPSSVNDDMRCATTYWLYLTLRRLGRDAEAEAALATISEDMEILENHAYHELLLLFRAARAGDVAVPAADASASIEDATRAYGLAAWLAAEGEPDAARARLERIVAGAAWPAFGFIAAEADLARAAAR